MITYERPGDPGPFPFRIISVLTNAFCPISPFCPISLRFRVAGQKKSPHSCGEIKSGDSRVRTCDLPHVKRMLSQLSYISNERDYTLAAEKKQDFFHCFSRAAGLTPEHRRKYAGAPPFPAFPDIFPYGGSRFGGRFSPAPPLTGRWPGWHPCTCPPARRSGDSACPPPD